MAMVERAAAAVEAARIAFADAGALARATQQEVADLLALTAELTRVIDAQRVRLAGAIAERTWGADEESICRLLGSRTARDAVGKAFGIRARDAAELLSMAEATTGAVGMTGEAIEAAFPRVGDALDCGAVSLAQAQAIVGILAPAAPRADVRQLAWAERCLVDAATDREAPLVPELLATQARAFVAVLDPDGILPDAERQRAARSLRMWQRADGMWKFEGLSPAEAGSALKAFLDAYTSPRTKVAFRDGDCQAEDGETADAGTDDLGAAPMPADDRSPAQKRHDVLIAAVEAHVASGGAPLAGGEVPRLVFNGTIEAFHAYARGLDSPDRALTIEHTGSIVPIETVGRLLCEAVVQRAVVDATGHVLELGREQRTFNRAQRRALAKKYRGCATPGCGMPVAWTEGHHVTWWQDGGPTDVDNGILLCSHCHHEVHAGRLLVVGTPGNWRVVPQLRPADRYARATRSGAAPSRAYAPSTAPAAAAAPLAVKLPEAVAKTWSLTSDAPDSPSGAIASGPATRRPHRAGPGRARPPVEARLHRRLARGGRGGSCGAIDVLRSSRSFVLRR